MPEIMNSQMKAGTKKSSVVKLDQLFDLENGRITEVFATLAEEGVTLTRISSASKRREFGFSPEVMDSLCDAWIAFKNECHDIEVDEAHRVKGVQKQIDTILKEYPEIELEEPEYGYYKIIRVAKLGFYQDGDTDPDAILSTLTEAKEAVDTHKTAYEKAMDLKDTYPEIIIKARDLGNGRRNWMFSIPSINYSDNVNYDTSIELLEALQCGVAMLEEHKAEAAIKELEAYAAAFKADENATIQLIHNTHVDPPCWTLTVPSVERYNDYFDDPVIALQVIKDDEAEIIRTPDATTDDTGHPILFFHNQDH